MKGFFNRVLRGDPAVSRYTCEDLPDEVLRRTLGGKGLGADTDKLSKRFLKEKNGEGASFSKEDLDDEKKFHYQSDMARTVSLVESGSYQMAFLLNSTKMDQIKEVAGNALIMPRKSTYFYPKILTGLVFNKIDPYEVIQAQNR